MGQDDITNDLGRDDLASDELVGESDYETVLWRAVLVLGLRDEGSSLLVVGLSGSPSAVLGLVSRVVRRVFGLLDEGHLREVAMRKVSGSL